MNPETIEILNNARADLLAGQITYEQFCDIRLSCVRAEIEAEELKGY